MPSVLVRRSCHVTRYNISHGGGIPFRTNTDSRAACSCIADFRISPGMYCGARPSYIARTKKKSADNRNLRAKHLLHRMRWGWALMRSGPKCERLSQCLSSQVGSAAAVRGSPARPVNTTKTCNPVKTSKATESQFKMNRLDTLDSRIVHTGYGDFWFDIALMLFTFCL